MQLQITTAPDVLCVGITVLDGDTVENSVEVFFVTLSSSDESVQLTRDRANVSIIDEGGKGLRDLMSSTIGVERKEG